MGPGGRAGSEQGPDPRGAFADLGATEPGLRVFVPGSGRPPGTGNQVFARLWLIRPGCRLGREGKTPGFCAGFCAPAMPRGGRTPGFGNVFRPSSPSLPPPPGGGDGAPTPPPAPPAQALQLALIAINSVCSSKSRRPRLPAPPPPVLSLRPCQMRGGRVLWVRSPGGGNCVACKLVPGPGLDPPSLRSSGEGWSPGGPGGLGRRQRRESEALGLGLWVRKDPKGPSSPGSWEGCGGRGPGNFECGGGGVPGGPRGPPRGSEEEVRPP